MRDPQASERLAAIRDFFLAENRAALATAYERLAALSPEAAPVVSDWQQVEFAFNRLFVGPRAPLAPPFASLYLEAEPQLMGRSTLQIRRIYNLLGLVLPWKNAIPDDHLSFELDAYRQLLIAGQAVKSSELNGLRDYFFNQHLNRWLPLFIDRIRESGEAPAAILFVVAELEQWVAAEQVVSHAIPLLV